MSLAYTYKGNLERERQLGMALIITYMKLYIAE